MTTILRDFGHTKRCHVMRTIQQPTVAEHSHGVALLCAQLYGGKPSANLLLAALYHDLPEHVTGDVPATAKWHYPNIAEALEKAEDQFVYDNCLATELTSEEKLTLRFADLLDLGFFCVDEITFGNRHVDEVYTNVNNALTKIVKEQTLPTEHFWELLNTLQARYEDATHR